MNVVLGFGIVGVGVVCGSVVGFDGVEKGVLV